MENVMKLIGIAKQNHTHKQARIGRNRKQEGPGISEVFCSKDRRIPTCNPSGK